MTLARAFLLLSGGFFLVVFALPILLAPMRWAQAFQWDDRATPLTLYFGRCLGAVATALTGITLWYAGSPDHQSLLLDLVAAAGAILTGVHMWGAVTRAQPWTEDAEILPYAAVTVLALYVRLTL